MNRAKSVCCQLGGREHYSYLQTLEGLGKRPCRWPEEWSVWSQNLGAESEVICFIGYGEVPSYRQAEIMRTLTNPDRRPPTRDQTLGPSELSYRGLMQAAPSDLPFRLIGRSAIL